MSRFPYFKTTFLPIFAGLFVGILIYGLFDIDFSNREALVKLLLKSFVTALTTGLILVILNVFFKTEIPQKKKQ